MFSSYDLTMQLRLLLRELIEALLDNAVGRGVMRGLFWPGIDRLILPVCYGLMRTLGPLFARLPFPIRVLVEKGILLFSILINRRCILDVVFEIATTIVIMAVGVRYGQRQRDDVELFFRLGTKVKDGNGVWHPHFRADMGSGNPSDRRNRFFPEALREGPRGHFWSDDAAGRQLHGRIAKTCSFFSILSYQSPGTIRDCRTNAQMLPDVSFHTVNTGRTEVDLNVFVDAKWQWAVVCFRGTESETLRDWLSSILVTRPAPFDTGQPGVDATVRSTYYGQVLSACQKYPLRPQPVTGERTALELLTSLSRANCKIYYTGHSLGGGLSILLSSFLAAHVQSTPTAVITFGSPPVAGNQAFVDWFAGVVPHASWRFINRHEFAPLAPPLPYTTTVWLLHVQQLIQAQTMAIRNPPVPTHSETIQLLDGLFRQRNLLSLILDHNPVSTLRALDRQIPES